MRSSMAESVADSPAPRRQLQWLTAAAVTVSATAVVVATSVLVTLGVLRSSATEVAKPEPPTIAVGIQYGDIQSLVGGTIQRIPRATFSVEASGTVTRDGALAGVVVEEGQAFAWLGRRPVIRLRGDVPARRDLGPGSRGSDVRSLQESLVRLGYKVTVSGKYGASTARAVYEMYRALGARPLLADGRTATKTQAHRSVLPLAEYVFSPTGAVQTVGQCGRWGQRLAGELCTLQTVAATLLIDVPTSQATAVSAGQPVLVTVGGAQHTATVQGEYLEHLGTETAPVRELRRFVIVLDAAMAPSDLLKIDGLGQIVVAAAEGQLLVPATAVHHDGTNAWLVTERGERIDIRLGLCSAGRCAVSGDALELTEGLRVVVPVEPK